MPKDRSAAGVVTRQPARGVVENLRRGAERRQHGRSVRRRVVPIGPHPLAVLAFVGRQAGVGLAGRIDDHEVVNDQRRSAYAVTGEIAPDVVQDIFRPDDVARATVEAIEDARRPDGINAAFVDRRRGPRAGAAHQLRLG